MTFFSLAKITFPNFIQLENCWRTVEEKVGKATREMFYLVVPFVLKFFQFVISFIKSYK